MNNPNVIQTAREKIDPVIASGLVIVALAATAIGIKKLNNEPVVKTANVPGQTPQTDPTGSSECDTWAETKANNDNNRVDGDGQVGLGDADTTKEARSEAEKWLEDRKDENPFVLAGMSKSMFNVNVDPNKYYDSEGCATPYAVQKVAELQGAIAVMKVSTKDPSANSINSGVSGGRFNQSGSRRITGDRSGITLVNPKTGEKIGLMARCANPTFEGNPGLPKGPTDQDPDPNPEGVTPKEDKNKTPAGVPGHNGGTEDNTVEPSRPKPGSSPDGARQPQKDKPKPIPQPEDTRDDATGIKPPAEEGNIPPVTQPPVNDNGSADKPKTEDPGGF